MAGATKDLGRQRGSGRRMAAWATVVALVLLIPLVAMQFTEEVAWSAADFVVAGVLLASAAVSYELATRLAASTAYRAAAGLAIATALLLVWMNLAVGLIGSEDNPANLMYGGVLAVALAGAAMARLRPVGMVRALVVTAIAQAMVAAIALVAGMGMPFSPPLEVLGVNAVFVGLWLLSAWLFRSSAERRTG